MQQVISKAMAFVVLIHFTHGAITNPIKNHSYSRYAPFMYKDVERITEVNNCI